MFVVFLCECLRLVPKLFSGEGPGTPEKSGRGLGTRLVNVCDRRSVVIVHRS